MKTRYALALLVSLIAASMMVAGCGLKSKKSRSQSAAIGGQDIPLTTTVEGIDFNEVKDSSFKGDAENIFRDVHFAYNDSRVMAEEEATLKEIAGFLNNNGSAIVLVEGHCDERGTNEYNLALGEKRSLYVRSFLVALGVKPERIHTISYGEEKPLDPAHTEEAWKQNRRAHFLIGKK